MFLAGQGRLAILFFAWFLALDVIRFVAQLAHVDEYVAHLVLMGFEGVGLGGRAREMGGFGVSENRFVRACYLSVIVGRLQFGLEVWLDLA